MPDRWKQYEIDPAEITASVDMGPIGNTAARRCAEDASAALLGTLSERATPFAKSSTKAQQAAIAAAAVRGHRRRRRLEGGCGEARTYVPIWRAPQLASADVLCARSVRVAWAQIGTSDAPAEAGVRYSSLRPGGACPAGFVFGADVVVVVGTGALLTGGTEADGNWPAPVEFDEAASLGLSVADRRAGICARALVPRIAAGLEGCRTGGSTSVVVSGVGSLVALGEDGAVVGGANAGVAVPDVCRSSLSGRWPVVAPGQVGNAPAKTRTANAPAATTAAPITRAAATWAA